MPSAASNYNKTLIQIQKLANSSAKSIQSMINKSNKAQMTFNSAEAQKSRDWQTEMSKTSHQMEVKDLKKAGLNPVLSTGGSGAQSYTTSSASTNNDSGASATAAILSDQLGAMSNMESARMNADASLKASERQAKATRYAAQQSAQAQKYAAKYAADQSFALGKYKADLAYQSQIEERENKKYLQENENAGTAVAFFDKMIKAAGLYKYMNKSLRVNLTSFLKGNNNSKSIWSDRGIMFKAGKDASINHRQLTSTGYHEVARDLDSAGFAVNKKSVDLYVRFEIFKDKSALKPLLKYYIKPIAGNKIRPWDTKPGYR